MKIAMTYDLRDDYLQQGYSFEETAEFDAVETINAIETALQKKGFIVERVGNIWELTAALVSGKRWDLVFNIAEGLHGLSREAQVPALLDAYRIPYTFSDASTLAIALDKAMSKHIVRDHSIPTAPFVTIATLADLNQFNLAFPVFAKPLAEGTSRGITLASRADCLSDLKNVCHHLLQTYHQPVIVESFLAGREFTVGIFGSGEEATIAGVMEIKMSSKNEKDIYSYANKEYSYDDVRHELVDDNEARLAGEVALNAWRALRCKDAGRVDIRSDAHGHPQFLEVNPLAGLHPISSNLTILMRLLGFSHEECIHKIVEVACKRLSLDQSKLQSTSICA